MAEETKEPDILGEDVKAFLVNSSLAQRKAAENAERARDANYQIESIIREAAASSVAVTRQKGIAALETQQATRQAAIARGVDPTGAAGVIIDTMNQLRESSAATLAQSKKVQDIKATSIWDNPAEFIKGNFFLPEEQRKLDAQIMHTKNLQDTMAGINSSIQQTAVTQQAISEVHTQATIEAAQVMAARDELVKANLAKIEGLKYDTQSVEVIAKASHDRVATLLAYKSSLNADVQLQIALENQKFNQADRDIRTQILKDAADERIEKNKVDEFTLAHVNRGYAALGAPQISAEEWKFQKQLFGKDPEMTQAYQIGRRSAALGVNIIGATPAEGLTVIENTVNNLPVIRQETVGWIAQIRDEISKPGMPYSAATKPEDKAAILNKAVAERLKMESGSIRKGSLFDIGDLKSYLGSSEDMGIADLKSLPISQKLLLPAIAAKVDLSDPKVVLDLGVVAVAKGEITSSEFLDISKIYQKATLLNQTDRGLISFGLVTPSETYKYPVKMGNIFSSATVNMNDPASLQQYLIKNMREYMGRPRPTTSPVAPKQ